MPPPEVLRGIFTTVIAAPASTTPRARSGCALTQGDGHDGSAPGHEDHAGQLARLTWCQAPPGMSARRRSPRTRLPGCLADRRLHQAHLDTGTLTVAVAVGLAASRRRPQTMTTNQTCCAPDPPFGAAALTFCRRRCPVHKRTFCALSPGRRRLARWPAGSRPLVTPGQRRRRPAPFVAGPPGLPRPGRRWLRSGGGAAAQPAAPPEHHQQQGDRDQFGADAQEQEIGQAGL